MNRLRRTILVALFSVSALAVAKVATIDLAQMAKSSQLIIIGEVTAIESLAGVRVASVRVIAPVSGKPPGQVAFVAEPTWRCDISKAVVGERVLLYLDPAVRISVEAVAVAERNGVRLYTLSHSGRGRIPLTLVGTTWLAGVSQEGKGQASLNVNLTLPLGAPIKTATDGSQFVMASYLVERSRAARK